MHTMVRQHQAGNRACFPCGGPTVTLCIRIHECPIIMCSTFICGINCLVQSNYSNVVVKEGGEPENFFWVALGGRAPYESVRGICSCVCGHVGVSLCGMSGECDVHNLCFMKMC